MVRERSILIYRHRNGSKPLETWLRRLKDVSTKARIFARIDRLRLGNFGDCRSVGGGVHELRVDHGPGHRIYFGLRGDSVVVLLCGGPKKTQKRDIEKAHRCWKEFKSNADD